MILPSPSTLYRFIKNIKCTAGINESVLEILRVKCEQMTPEDKTCVICIDELSIKSHLYYNYGRDEIIGLEDNGMNKTLLSACSACVFMLRGLRAKWKQPIAYVLSNTNMSSVTVVNVLDRLIEKLYDSGFDVVALITDMGSNFIEMSNMLSITPEDPTFTIGNKSLFYFFDPPHLIKATRNNLMMNTISWNNGTAKWSHIKSFYDKEKVLTHRRAPKLTDSHINPSNFEKMRVCYAVQVLSYSTVAGIALYTSLGSLPEEASQTVEFISRFDKLFDIFNSSELKSPKQFRCAFRGQSEQVEFLQDTL